MKKALAILMTIALVSTAAFADVGKTVTPAPTVTLGVTASVETDLFAAQTIGVTAPGKSAAATDALAVKSEPTGLGNNPLMFTKDWVNLDWSQFSIKAEGKYDAFRSDDDDAKCTGFYVTSTWKNFYGFSIAHEYGINNKADKAATTVTNNPVLAKNSTNKVTVKTTANGMSFWTVYNANTIFGLANLATAGQAVEGIFDGFTQLGFEYDDATQFYTKLVLKNTPSNGLYVDKSLSSVVDASGTSTVVAQGPSIDTAIFEARKMFDVWTVRINDKSENKIRIQNLGSDCKISDVESFVVGKDWQIQNTDTAAVAASAPGVTPVVAAVAAATGLKGINFYNTITPLFNLTIKVNALAPLTYGTTKAPTTALTVADWLKGDNLTLGAAYLITDVGTIDAGIKVSNDYVINRTTTTTGAVAVAGSAPGVTPVVAAIPEVKGTPAVEGPTKLLAAVVTTAWNDTTGHVINAVPVSWGNAFWLGAKLDKKLFGDAANKSIYVGLDMKLGQFVDATATYKDWLAKTDTNKSFVITPGSATLTNLQAEAKAVLLGDGTAAGSLSVNAGLKATLLGGYTYAALAPTADGTSVKAGDFSNDVLKGLNVDAANNWVSANYTEANFMNKFYGDGKATTSPFGLQIRADYVVSPVIKNVYIKDSYTAVAGTLAALDSPVAPATSVMRTPYGFYDKNVITLGTALFATKKGTLTVSGNYNMFLGLPTASQLYKVGASDADKKTIDQLVSSKYNSGDFSPFNLHIAYTYTY